LPAQGGLAYGQAAPFALLMTAIAAVPSYVLGRFFDRLPARDAAVSSPWATYDAEQLKVP